MKRSEMIDFLGNWIDENTWDDDPHTELAIEFSKERKEKLARDVLTKLETLGMSPPVYHKEAYAIESRLGKKCPYQQVREGWEDE